MKTRPDVRVAIIGYGTMGRAHSYAYRAASMIRDLPCRPILAGLRPERDQCRACGQLLRLRDWSTNWREAVERDDVDIVDICTPPGTHLEIIRSAARAGKAILCEKPLAISYAEAREAADLVAERGVLNAVGFNYRRLPALALMLEMAREGRIGDVHLWRATWLSDEFLDPTIPFDWRFDRALGGTTIADLGTHLIDLARSAVGEVETVVAQSKTFVGERANPVGGPPLPVSVDDASSGLLRFQSGARERSSCPVCPRGDPWTLPSN